MSPLTHFTIYSAILTLNLSMTEKLLLCLIITFAKRGLGMSNATIGQAFNVAESTVANTLSALRKRGLIQTEKAGSRHRKIRPNTEALLHLLKSEVEEIYLTDLVNLLHFSLSKLPHSLGSEQKKKNIIRREVHISSVDFIDFWNSHNRLPKIHTFTPQRKKALAKCSREPEFAEHWKEIIDKLSRSSFHTGQNQRGWKATVDWLLKDGNYIKILELEDPQAEPDYSAALSQYTHDATEEEAEELLKEVVA